MKSHQTYSVPLSVLDLRLQEKERHSSYATSYVYLLEALAGRQMTTSGYVAAAHMVYGWMPTVLTLKTKSPDEPFLLEATILERVRNGADVTDAELEILKSSINNSIVGLSKLLHFLCPTRYAIWDSKVYLFMKSEARPNWSAKVDHQDVNKISRFKHYMTGLKRLVEEPAFQSVHTHVNETFGYEVSALRAAEVLMYAGHKVKK
jgi:hypothetical protein